MSDIVLEGQNLTGSYGERPVLGGVDLVVRKGEWLSVLGPNGSGKSTLLKLLSSLLPASRGSVLLDGRAIGEYPAGGIARTLAWVGQQPLCPRDLTVRELVGLGRGPYRRWWQWQADPKDLLAIDAAMASTSTGHLADRPVEQLSGGERQRAFLAMALAQGTQILLLDEPIAHLDVCYQLEILHLLAQINRDFEITLVTVLHEINLAARYSHRLALMSAGRLHAVGRPDQVLSLENLNTVFGVEVEIVQTSVGPQILPIAPRGSRPRAIADRS